VSIRLIPCRACVAALCIVAGPTGCRHTIAVEPIEVKPIHMTLDINLKVDRELDEFFDDVEPPATAPVSQADVPATSPEAVAVEGEQP
jgi:hypothetical protein